MKIENPEAYDYAVRRNREIDAWRAARANERKAENLERQASEFAALEAARVELASVIASYRQVCRPAETEWKWLDALSVLCGFETDEQIRVRHDASRDQVYQWRRRGLLLLLGDFSETLRKYIDSGRLRRPHNWSAGKASARKKGYQGRR